MTGLMMDYPLTLTHILERSAKIYPHKDIASRLPDGSIHRYSYRDFHKRVHRLAHALQSLGVRTGDRIGTLCWNSSRHLELYFAAPCAGYVLHTLNLRLASEQLAYVINHAEDRIIFVDAALLSILEPIRGELKSVIQIVALNDVMNEPDDMLDYEALLAAAPAEPYPWPKLDENAAAAELRRRVFVQLGRAGELKVGVHGTRKEARTSEAVAKGLGRKFMERMRQAKAAPASE